MTLTGHHPHPSAPPVEGAAPRHARRRMAPALYALHVVARFFIAAALLMYSGAKVFGTQLAYSTITADTPISSLTGFELMWQFYGWSRPFVALIVAAQVTAAVLVVVPRTTRLGYLLTIALMGNIVAMDVFYGVSGGLEAALAVLGAALVLLLVDARPLLRFLFAAPMVPAAVKPRAAVRFGWLRWVALPVLAAGAVALPYALVQQPGFGRTELHGVWEAAADTAPGGLVRFYVDDNQACAIRDRGSLLDRPRYGECTVDEQGDRLTVGIVDPDGALPDFRFAGGYALSADGARLVLRPDDGSAEIVLTRLEERERGLDALGS